MPLSVLFYLIDRKLCALNYLPHLNFNLQINIARLMKSPKTAKGVLVKRSTEGSWWASRMFLSFITCIWHTYGIEDRGSKQISTLSEIIKSKMSPFFILEKLWFESRWNEDMRIVFSSPLICRNHILPSYCIYSAKGAAERKDQAIVI